MTREGAANILKTLKSYYNDKSEDSYVGFNDEDNKALDMAIKALEQTRWIPVWERLPEKKGTYLVTQKATFTDFVYISVIGYALNLYDVDEYDFANKKRSGWYEYDSEWGYRELDNVIAWMPLVEPYGEVK